MKEKGWRWIKNEEKHGKIWKGKKKVIKEKISERRVKEDKSQMKGDRIDAKLKGNKEVGKRKQWKSRKSEFLGSVCVSFQF